MKKYLVVIFLIGIFCWNLPAQAQEGLGQFEVDLRLINQTPAVRNPRFVTDTQIFDLRVADTNRTLVGKPDDLMIGPAGQPQIIVSEITRVGRERRTVQHNYDRVEYLEQMSAYEIPLIYEANNEISPQAQAALSPSMDASKMFSLRGMKGAEVYTIDGRWIGKVTDILFDEQLTGIEALVVQNVPGARRYDEIAIPFDPGLVSIRHNYGVVEFRVHPAAGQVLMEYGRAQR